MLKVIDLKKSFGDQMVLKGLSFEAQPGLLTILEGQNGAGKSTLFTILAGSLSKDEGQILLNELDLVNFRHSEKVAILEQDPKISSAPNLTVMENLILFLLKSRRASLKTAIRSETRQQVLEHLRNLDLISKHLELPMGQLSGGQRQILAFAMQSINQPSLLLLDEPTAALDPKMSHLLMKLIKKLVEKWNIPAVMISHDHELNQSYGDKIIELRDGQIFQH